MIKGNREKLTNNHSQELSKKIVINICLQHTQFMF